MSSWPINDFVQSCKPMKQKTWRHCRWCFIWCSNTFGSSKLSSCSLALRPEKQPRCKRSHDQNLVVKDKLQSINDKAQTNTGINTITMTMVRCLKNHSAAASGATKRVDRPWRVWLSWSRNDKLALHTKRWNAWNMCVKACTEKGVL